MNNPASMESEDVQDFGDIMKHYLENMDNELKKHQEWKQNGGHPETTSTTCSSDDYDEDDDAMIDVEDESTYLIGTHSFDPPIPFSSSDNFRNRTCTRERPKGTDKASRTRASFCGDPIDIPVISMGLDLSSAQTSMCDDSDFEDNQDPHAHNICKMVTCSTLFTSFDQIDLPLPAPVKNMPAFPMPHRYHGESQLNSQRNVRQPNHVGDLNVDSFQVLSRPGVPSNHFLGKLSSSFEYTLVGRAESDIRKQPKDMVQCTSTQQAEIRKLMSSDNSAKVTNGLGQKRCRRRESLQQENAENNHVLVLGQGESIQCHSDIFVLLQQFQEHQRDYKRVKI